MPELTAEFGALPSSTRFAFLAARKWHQVDDAIGDDDALAQGLITPETLLLLMQIIQEVMKCLSNSSARSWQRVKSHVDSVKPLDKLADQMRLNGMINVWLTNLGIPREAGDVVMVREALAQMASGMQEAEFNKVKAEMLFYAI